MFKRSAVKCKATVRRSVLAAGLAVLALGTAAAVPAQADVSGSPGYHNLQVLVPSKVKSVFVNIPYTSNSGRCYDNVTAGKWNDLKRLVPNGGVVEAWGYSVKCADRDSTHQVAYGSKTVPADSLANFWHDTMH